MKVQDMIQDRSRALASVSEKMHHHIGVLGGGFRVGQVVVAGNPHFCAN